MLDVAESMAAFTPGQEAQVADGYLRKAHTLIRWRPHDLVQARRDREELSSQARLLLIDLNDLLFERNGCLIDDDPRVARALGRDIRVWRRLKAVLIACERLWIGDDDHLRTRETEDELPKVRARMAAATRTAACGRVASSSARLPEDFRQKSSRKPLIPQESAQHRDKIRNLPPNPPPSGGQPEPTLFGQDDPAFDEVWAAWPAEGRKKRKLGYKHWQAKLAAGLPVELLQARCMDRARDRRAKMVGLASFLRDADFVGEAIRADMSVPVWPEFDLDEDALRRVDVGLLLTWGGQLPLERAYATIGEAEVLRLARLARVRQLDHRDSWRLVEQACMQADPEFRRPVME